MTAAAVDSWYLSLLKALFPFMPPAPWCSKARQRQTRIPSHPYTTPEESLKERRLDLETPGSPAATGLLELPALALHVRLLVAVGPEAEVLDSLAGVLGPAEQEGVGAGRGAHGELVDGEALAAGLEDAGA